MREFGKIATRYWEWALEHGLSEGETLTGAYLLSCKHGNSLGCFHLPMAYLAADLDQNIDVVTDRVSTLCQHGLVTVCTRTRYLLFTKYLRWNPLQNPSHGKGLLKIINALPSNFQLYPQLLESLKNFGGPNLPQQAVNTVSTRCKDADPKVSRECRHTKTETETETERGLSKDKPASRSSKKGQEKKPKPKAGKKGGRHFASQLDPNLVEQINAECVAIEKLSPKPGITNVLRPWMFVQKAVNAKKHPGAIHDALRNTRGAWDVIETGYMNYATALLNKFSSRYNEQESARACDEFKTALNEAPAEIQNLMQLG
jgi:hypothetical protein